MSVDKSNKFSCLIVGSGTLPIRCAEILLHCGQEICAIASSDAEVKKWAKENKISHLTPGANLAQEIDLPFDYLFSIVNEHILREDVLQLPRKLAINYHDAPLPKYAGTHATSWALMNGETSHGISWHVITDVVDAGDILKQERVEIANGDTALTLNTKCYEAALNAFTELVEDLSTGNVVGKKQNLEERTFFPRFKRPINGSLISWNSCAAEISALVRALNFGNHPNPLGAAKFAVKNEFFIVSELETLESASESVAGTINEIGEDFLRISTANKEIILRKILSLDGQSVSISDLTAKFHLHEGYQFADIDAKKVQRIEGLYKANCKHESYWVKKLSGLEPAVPPFANSTATSDSANYENVPMPIPDEVLTFLEQSQEERKTSNFILAAFGALLARLGGVNSFDVAYSDSETQSEIAGLEKLFSTQTPFRFNVDCLQNFNDFYKALKEETEPVKNHKTYAHDLIIRFPQLRLPGEFGNKFALPVVIAKVERFDDYAPIEGNELTLMISENESEIGWIYDRNKMDAENIDKLIRHFTTFLKGIVANSECQIAYLPLLTEKERHQLLVEWNDNQRDYPKDKCIHQLFEAQVNRTPDAVALIFGDEHLTYQELNRRANQLARHLQTLGVGAEILVGICVERSIEMIVGVLGILKAGGSYVPLDPVYPKDRLAYMLEDSQASVLLTQQKLVSELSQHQAKIVCLDSDWQKIAQEAEENPISSVTPNNLAYVIYTSGSTGKPKGVAIEHRNTVAFLSWANSVFTVNQLKGTLASTSVCFDLSLYEMFAPLSCGGTVILVENVLHLPTAPAANEVTLINTVPSAITELLRIKGVPASVRTVNLAGEPLKTSLVRQIYETETVREVFDLYGPSEDTTYSTFTLRDTGKATIGRPISNTQAYILDRYLQPVPIGIPGELYLGGNGLARGYLNRRKLTDERFIKNLFDTEPTARLYKTGDLVRYLPTGEIEYLGRIDNQVKIRGFRIELGEIETMLLAHPEIREAVVIAREDQSGDKRLAAYFVSEQEQTVKINDLRDYLKQKLPDYMIPSAFVELDEMPLTPNGKINRKALPAPISDLSESDRDFVAHRDDLESKLVKIWETILDVQPIGVQDNFFELGGHSLQAVRMFAEIEETFGKNIPLATLFEASTIEKLADILRQEGWAAPESSIVPIQPDGRKPPFFCVHAKGGNVLFYRDLAKHLGNDQPFYGIQARRLGGRQVGHATVEEMAEFYIKEMQMMQPQGPYYLGGSSFGGLAIFEIAQQLHNQGQKVALLALFDTGTPNYPKVLPNTTALRSKIYELIRRIQHHRDSLKAFNSKERANYLLDKLKKAKLQYRRKIVNTYKKIVRKFYLKTKGTGSIPKNYIQIEDQIWKAGLKYQPQIYPGKMTLFRASNQPLGIQPDPTLGWENFVAGGIEIHDVPGHHGSIVAEPYVGVLAEKLNNCLALAQTETQQTTEKPMPIESDKCEFVKAAGFQSVS
ncbi:MAG: amino acid adenylation domain-containing protein [Actinomycetota bacterium]